LSETVLILRRTERDVIRMYIGLHVKYPLLLPDFNETWIFSTNFRKILKFHENTSFGSRVVPGGRMDRRADTTKLRVVFRNFANASKMSSVCV